jgi:hypothetical protein
MSRYFRLVGSDLEPETSSTCTQLKVNTFWAGIKSDDSLPIIIRKCSEK